MPLFSSHLSRHFLLSEHLSHLMLMHLFLPKHPGVMFESSFWFLFWIDLLFFYIHQPQDTEYEHYSNTELFHNNPSVYVPHGF